MGFLGKMYGKRSPDFINGFLAGLQEYAWWKDGVQYVGSCGTTLKEAMEEVVQDLSECPEDFDINKIIKQGFI